MMIGRTGKYNIFLDARCKALDLYNTKYYIKVAF